MSRGYRFSDAGGGIHSSSPLVPVMSSYTSSVGTCSATTTLGDNYAWKVFDSDANTYWESQGVSGQTSSYVQFSFTNPVHITKVKWTCYYDPNRYGENYKILASANGTDFYEILPTVSIAHGDLYDKKVVEYDIEFQTTAYSYIRFYEWTNAAYQGLWYSAVREIQFYGYY